MRSDLAVFFSSLNNHFCFPFIVIWLGIFCTTGVIMHMSSACPWGRTPGQPGKYVGEYKGMNWLLCPWAGANSRHCFEFEGKGWGNSKFYKITDANHGDIRGICRVPQPINTGNIKGAKRSETEDTRFRAFCKASCSQNGHLMLSMISYVNLSSGVYIRLY